VQERFKEIIATAQAAAKEKQQLKILYEKSDGSKKWRIVSPYSYKAQYENCGGILFAEQDGHIKSFAVDKILEIEILPAKFKPKWKIEF